MSSLAELCPVTDGVEEGNMDNKVWLVAGVMLELAQLVVMLLQRSC